MVARSQAATLRGPESRVGTELALFCKFDRETDRPLTVELLPISVGFRGLGEGHVHVQSRGNGDMLPGALRLQSLQLMHISAQGSAKRSFVPPETVTDGLFQGYTTSPPLRVRNKTERLDRPVTAGADRRRTSIY